MTEIQEKLLEALSASLKGESVEWEPLSQEELSELYNWDSIDCVSNNKMKSVEEIHEEIMKIVRINLND